MLFRIVVPNVAVSSCSRSDPDLRLPGAMLFRPDESLHFKRPVMTLIDVFETDYIL